MRARFNSGSTHIQAKRKVGADVESHEHAYWCADEYDAEDNSPVELHARQAIDEASKEPHERDLDGEDGCPGEDGACVHQLGEEEHFCWIEHGVGSEYRIHEIERSVEKSNICCQENCSEYEDAIIHR